MLPSNRTPPDQPRRWLLSSLVRVKHHVGSVPLAPTSIPIVDAVLISHDDGDLHETHIDDEDGRDGRLTEVERQVQSLWWRFLRTSQVISSGPTNLTTTTTTTTNNSNSNNINATETVDATTERDDTATVDNLASFEPVGQTPKSSWFVCAPACRNRVLWYTAGGFGLGVAIIAVVAGVLCLMGRCRPGKPMLATTAPVAGAATTSTPPPQRVQAILDYLNPLTLMGQNLSYPDDSTAEGRAVRWLIDDDLGTAPSDELSIRQRYVLAMLTWTNISVDECDWYGVDCDTGRVTALTLDGDGVQGYLPNDLGLLTALTRLDLPRNELSGPIPSSLEALTRLTYLALSYNDLVGTIPATTVGAWTDMEYLYLGSNELTGTIPSSLAALTYLTDLSFWNNRLKGTIPSSLWTLTFLEYLDLSNNKLHGTIPSSMLALTALTMLDLQTNNLGGTVPFCNSGEQKPFSSTVDCDQVSCPCCVLCGWS